MRIGVELIKLSKLDNFILETVRTLIRPLTPADATEFYELNMDPEVVKFTGDVPFESTESAREFLESYDQYKKYGVGRMAVIDKTNHEFLGWCGLKYSPDLKEYDLGFRFFRKHWNKGYATETSKAFLDFAFTKLPSDEIVGRAMLNNVASIRVLQKIGMTFSKEFDFEGQNGVIYSIKKQL